MMKNNNDIFSVPSLAKEPHVKKERNIQKLALTFIENPSNETFRRLAERINWGLRKYIFDIVKDNDAIDDVLSRTLENIYFKRDQFDKEKANFSTWMYRIALNNSLKYIQEKKKAQANSVSEDFEDIYDSEMVSDDAEDTAAHTDSHANSDQIIDMIFDGSNVQIYDKERVFSEIYDASIDCISYLPDNLRIVMRDRLILNKKIDDIAIDNKIPISSVKNWLRKGRIVLQETIKERYENLYEMYMYGEIMED